MAVAGLRGRPFPTRLKISQFPAVFLKIWQNRMLAPLLTGGILDPPLHGERSEHSGAPSFPTQWTTPQLVDQIVLLFQEKKLWVAPISDSPKPPPQRITLTFPVIQNCRNAVFVSCGAGKAEMVKVTFPNYFDFPGNRFEFCIYYLSK